MRRMHRLFLFFVLCVPLLAEDAILEHARQVNLEFAAHMPNFVAHEVVTDYVDRKGSGQWEHNYTVEDEITVKGNQVSRQALRRNGKLLHFREWFRGGGPPTGFGAALEPLFNPHCPTTLEFAGDDDLRGKAVLAYRFHSPANGCFGNLYVSQRSTYNAARTGRVLIDGPSGNLLQFEEDAFGFPEPYGLVARHQVMTWDYVKIGDVSYWLPVSAEFVWTFKTPYRRRQVVEYRNHRHFESTTDVQYK
jgi:hypothetical protein